MGVTRKHRNGGGLFGNSLSKLKSQMGTLKKHQNFGTSYKQLNANIQSATSNYNQEIVKYKESKAKASQLWSKLLTLKAKKLSYAPRYGFNPSARINAKVQAQRANINTRKDKIRRKQQELTALLNTPHRSSMPPGSMPPGSMPPGYMQPGSMPHGYMPHGYMPPGSMPPGSMPPGYMQPAAYSTLQVQPQVSQVNDKRAARIAALKKDRNNAKRARIEATRAKNPIV